MHGLCDHSSPNTNLSSSNKPRYVFCEVFLVSQSSIFFFFWGGDLAVVANYNLPIISYFVNDDE